MTKAPPLLALDDVTAGYREPVVGPVSLRVRPGEILGLTGDNGAGKTTLLRAITGDARLFGGRVHRPAGLTIAHHRQRLEAPPDLPLTGAELLHLAGADGAPPPHRVEGLRSRCLDEMSGGQYQFLLAWACLAGPAQLVLMDEPSNNLDGGAIELLLARIKALEPHRAVLMVSHEPDFLAGACTRVVSL